MAKPKAFSLILIACSLICLLGCDKTKKNDTYSLKGRMLKDCSGTPLASYSLRLWYKAASSLEDSKDLGTATTDANGNFKIDNIPFGNRGSLYLFHDINANDKVKWWDNFNVPIRDGEEEYELGAFYATSQENTIFRLNIDTSKFSGTDSLYIGPDHYNFKIVSPIPSSIVLTFGFTNGARKAQAPSPYLIRWSTRKAHYDSLTSPNPPIDKDQHSFSVPASLCNYPDTSFITIQ